MRTGAPSVEAGGSATRRIEDALATIRQAKNTDVRVRLASVESGCIERTLSPNPGAIDAGADDARSQADLRIAQNAAGKSCSRTALQRPRFHR
jgi:hypothetical protein